jgi:hypothetical protein
MGKKLVLTLSVLAVALCAVSAEANTFIEISGTGPGWYTFTGRLGSTFSGCSTWLTVWRASPVPGPRIALPGASLCFTSGPATSFGLIDTFASGGSVTISGRECVLNCFHGAFTGAQYDIANSIFSAPFVTGLLDNSVWTMLGFPPYFAGPPEMSLTATLIPTSDEGGLIGSFDMTVIPEPEPSSIALLGSGLLIGGFVRRKFAA